MWTSVDCLAHISSHEFANWAALSISSIWVHQSFIKSSNTNKMQILRKLQLMTAGCLFWCSFLGHCLPPPPLATPGHHHHYSVLSLQCTWEPCSRPRLLDREAPGKNIWCAVKLSSTRYQILTTGLAMALVTTGNHPMYHCLCMGPALTSILAWCNKGQHLAEHPGPGYSFTLAIIQGNIGQIGFKPYLVQLFWQILDDFSTLITLASTQYIVSEQPISGQSGELMQHEHWTLTIIPPGVTTPAQIQALVTGVSGANGNLALGLGHEMVSTLL